MDDRERANDALAIRVCAGTILATAQIILGLGLLLPLGWVVVAAVSASGIRQSLALDTALLAALGRSVLIALAAMTLTTLLALPAGLAVGGVRHRAARWALAAILSVPLLVPSYVHAYWWELLRGWLATPGSVGPVGRVLGGWVQAAWVTAAWLWPIPALLLAAGWRRAGASVYELALLDLTPRRARALVVAVVLRPVLAASAAAVAVLALVEYAIPHLCLVNTYAGELFARAELRGTPLGSFAWQCWPLWAAATAGVIGLTAVGRRAARQPTEDLGHPARTAAGSGIGLVVVLAATLIGPVAYAALQLGSATALRESLQAFQSEWASSLRLSVAVAAGAFVVGLGLSSEAGSAREATLRSAWLIVALLLAVLPAALVGSAFINLFDRPGVLGRVYESPLVWWLAETSRFVFIALLAATAGAGPAGHALGELCRLDGLRTWQRLWYVRLPRAWRSCLAAALAAGLLTLSEVAVSTLVRPPGTGVLAVSLLNQMHFGRQDSVIASSLLMLLPAAMAAATLCVVMAARRRAGG